MQFQMILLLLFGALWHVGTAWIAGSYFRLDLGLFLIVIAIASVISTKISAWFVPAAVMETDIWSLFGISITQDTILSLIALLISSFGFYWVVKPCYGMSGYLAAVTVSYAAAYLGGFVIKLT